MSQHIAELTRRGHEAFNRRDLEAYLGLNDPAVEYTPSRWVRSWRGP